MRRQPDYIKPIDIRRGHELCEIVRANGGRMSSDALRLTAGFDRNVFTKANQAARRLGLMAPIRENDRQPGPVDWIVIDAVIDEKGVEQDEKPFVHRIVTEWKRPASIPVNSVFALGEAA